MRLGLLTVVFNHLGFEEALDRVVAEGLDTVELGTGNYPGNSHCDPDSLLQEATALARFRKQLASAASESARWLVTATHSIRTRPSHANTIGSSSSRSAWPRSSKSTASRFSPAAPADWTAAPARIGSPVRGHPSIRRPWTGSGGRW